MSIFPTGSLLDRWTQSIENWFAYRGFETPLPPPPPPAPRTEEELRSWTPEMSERRYQTENWPAWRQQAIPESPGGSIIGEFLNDDSLKIVTILSLALLAIVIVKGKR